MPTTRFFLHQRVRGQAIIALLLLSTGCKWVTAEEPDDVPPEEIIDLTRTGVGALPANGSARDTLFARIPNNATLRQVTFVTTAGTFELTNSKEAKIRAERDAINPKGPLVAKIVLRADTLTSTAIVSALVSDFRDTVWVPMIR